MLTLVRLRWDKYSPPGLTVQRDPFPSRRRVLLWLIKKIEKFVILLINFTKNIFIISYFQLKIEEKKKEAPDKLDLTKILQIFETLQQKKTNKLKLSVMKKTKKIGNEKNKHKNGIIHEILNSDWHSQVQERT